MPFKSRYRQAAHVQGVRTELVKGIENFARYKKAEELKVLGLENGASVGNILEKFERPSWVKWIGLVLNSFIGGTWDQFLEIVMRLIVKESLPL